MVFCSCMSHSNAPLPVQDTDYGECPSSPEKFGASAAESAGTGNN